MKLRYIQMEIMKGTIKKIILIIAFICLLTISYRYITKSLLLRADVNISADTHFSLSLWKQYGKIYGSYCLISSQKSNCPFVPEKDGVIDEKYKNLELIDLNNDRYIFSLFDNRTFSRISMGQVSIEVNENKLLWQILERQPELIIPLSVSMDIKPE